MQQDRDGDPPDLAAGKRFEVSINGTVVSISDDDPSGRDLRAAAHLNPASAFVLIEIRDRGATSIGLDDKVGLRRGETAVFRAFESDRLFTFTLDERAWEWGQLTILESELRQYGDVPDDKDIVLDKDRDEVVARGAVINLGGQGAEQFVTRNAPPRKVEIRVNGRKRKVDPGLITYEAIVELAFPNVPPNPDVIYTVSFRHGPPSKPEGSLVAGQSVEVREGMIFVATPTNRS